METRLIMNKKISFKNKMYVNGYKKRFKGKGENDLKKLALKAQNLEEWKKRSAIIRKGILKGANLNPLPKKTPLNVVIHSLREYKGYQVENVYFESVPGFFVTGSLYRPNDPSKNSTKNHEGKMPVLLKPHGHKKNKRYTDDNQFVCSTFARLGVIVFTYDMVGYACSTQVEHKIKSACTLQTWNSIRALDFILSLPDADSTRVGVTGGSGGGTQTFLLTAVDDRVTCCAPVVMVSSFFYGGCVCESGLPIHKGDNYKTNNAEISAMAAPRPQLIVSVGGDWTRLTPILEYPFIKNIYNYYNAPELVENAHFEDEVHNYGPSKRQAAYKFFAKHLKLDIKVFLNEKGAVDEEKYIFEEEALLKVFNKKHPRPNSALKNEEEIIKKIKELQGKYKQ